MVRWTTDLHSEKDQARLLEIVQGAHDEGELVHDYEAAMAMHAVGALPCDCCDPHPWRRRLLMPFKPGTGKGTLKQFNDLVELTTANLILSPKMCDKVLAAAAKPKGLGAFEAFMDDLNHG